MQGPHLILNTCSSKRNIILKRHMNFYVRDLYSALPELKLTSGPLVEKIGIEEGIGTLILSAIPGLITLAVESVSSWIKGKQQR